jgi:2-oxoglutarate ferredoxin oxidoreductase subunit beta
VHVVQPELTTIVVTGDGDCYGEGGNHFIHTLRRNPDITVVVHNNEIYALTKGQASPTTPRGERRTLQIRGVDLTPLNMPAVAIQHGCTFVARGFAGNMDHLKRLLVKAVKHKGFSYVDVIQPCITWGTHPLSWYKHRIKELGEDHDPGDKEAAMEQTVAGEEGIPIGILYEGPPRETFTHKFRRRVAQGPLTQLDPPGSQKVKEILSRFHPTGAPKG